MGVLVYLRGLGFVDLGVISSKRGLFSSSTESDMRRNPESKEEGLFQLHSSTISEIAVSCNAGPTVFVVLCEH
jgi:hypothetical protein